MKYVFVDYSLILPVEYIFILNLNFQLTDLLKNIPMKDFNRDEEGLWSLVFSAKQLYNVTFTAKGKISYIPLIFLNDQYFFIVRKGYNTTGKL